MSKWVRVFLVFVLGLLLPIGLISCGAGTSNNCGDPNMTYPSITVGATQNGNSITLTGFPEGTVTAQICGNVITFPGSSFPEDGGTTTENATTVTVTSSTSFNGSFVWNWTVGSFSCSGNSNFAATKTGNSVPPPVTSGIIDVVSGDYGVNCGVQPGFGTNHLASSCDGNQTCAYLIDYQVIGDPKIGCSKDYTAKWRCGSDSTILSVYAAAEASGKTITLTCQ